MFVESLLTRHVCFTQCILHGLQQPGVQNYKQRSWGVGLIVGYYTRTTHPHLPMLSIEYLV